MAKKKKANKKSVKKASPKSSKPAKKKAAKKKASKAVAKKAVGKKIVGKKTAKKAVQKKSATKKSAKKKVSKKVAKKKVVKKAVAKGNKAVKKDGAAKKAVKTAKNVGGKKVTKKVTKKKAATPKVTQKKVAQKKSVVSSADQNQKVSNVEGAKDSAKKTPKDDEKSKNQVVSKSGSTDATLEPDHLIDSEDDTQQPADVVLTDAEGRRYCRVRDCDQLAAVEGYCRFHYLLLWKNIQVRKKILSEGKLSKYIEDLTARYPDKYMDMLRKDLRSEKDFLSAIQELELDENSDDSYNEEEDQSFIDEVRGISDSGSARDDDDY